MPGELKDDIVTVSDQKEGSTLYNKGNYGYPIRGGGVDLDLLEATYLLESKRLQVLRSGAEMTFEELFLHSSGVHEDFDIRYMVYRDIRQRGFVIKSETGGFDFSVFPRGKTISNSRPQYVLKAVSERSAFGIGTFADDLNSSEKKDRQLLYGIVDEEGDLTYYLVSGKEPSGSVSVSQANAVTGRLVRDRVFVFKDAANVYENGFFGKTVEGMLQLSLIESCYLMKKGMLSVMSSDSVMGLDELIGFSGSVQDEFGIRFAVFSDLRDKGLLVKTGFKYGTHFRVYENHPDKCHARYLVHSVGGDGSMPWPEISRTVRLAHGVKKEILFCSPDLGTGYIDFRRFRP